MRFPLSLTADMASYMVKKKLAGEKRFPLVLMLEPLHACNLTCTGCGRIREYATTIKEKLTRRGVPGGGRRVRRADREHLRRRADDLSQIDELVAGILQAPQAHLPLHQRHVHPKKLTEFKPTSRFFFNVHLDGMEKTHDIAVEREGVFDEAVEGIKAAKEAGFLVCTNTTIYKETDMHEIDELFAYLTELGVDGFMLSPGLRLRGRAATNPDGAAEIFLTRDDITRSSARPRSCFKQVQDEHVADLPGVPAGQARADVHRLGQPDPQREGLEGPVLPDHRRAPRDASTT